jgi:tRNA-2-methylthio-N6-dimethylallyladenosine synthase
MDDDVPREEKEDRLARVIALQERITEAHMAQLVGTEQTVLIDAAHPRRRGVMNGRTDGFRPVSVPGDFEIGDVVPVRVTGFAQHWLEAEALPVPAHT